MVKVWIFQYGKGDVNKHRSSHTQWVKHTWFFNHLTKFFKLASEAK